MVSDGQPGEYWLALSVEEMDAGLRLLYGV